LGHGRDSKRIYNAVFLDLRWIDAAGSRGNDKCKVSGPRRDQRRNRSTLTMSVDSDFGWIDVRQLLQETNTCNCIVGELSETSGHPIAGRATDAAFVIDQRDEPRSREALREPPIRETALWT
jgi:hypothetical protein